MGDRSIRNIADNTTLKVKLARSHSKRNYHTYGQLVQCNNNNNNETSDDLHTSMTIYRQWPAGQTSLSRTLSHSQILSQKVVEIIRSKCEAYYTDQTNRRHSSKVQCYITLL